MKRLRIHFSKREAALHLKKSHLVLLLAPLLASCASAPLVLSPVGPGPVDDGATTPGKGNLEVYTETEEYGDDMAVPFYRHTGYWIYQDGKRLERVWNHQDVEDEDPSVVSLPPGRYLVRAQAERYGPVEVPVVIEADRTTRVVLQPGWKPPVLAERSELVRIPGGYPVGWKASELPAVTKTSDSQSNKAGGE